MGLSRSKIARLGYVWYWRARYWWMDTENGLWTRCGVIGLLVLLSISHMISAAVALLTPPSPDEPIKAYAWIYQLVIAIVMALISYALRPKIEGVQPSNQAAPTVEDGQGIDEFHGDCWSEDPFINAQRVVGQEPIKSKGKK